MFDKNLVLKLSGPDINKYLANGYMRIQTPIDQKPTWTFIEKYSLNLQTREKELVLSRDEKLGAIEIKQLKLEFQFPTSGLYPYKNGAMIVQRIPTRTNIKIIDHTTLSVFPLFGINTPGKSLQEQAFPFSCTTLETLFTEVSPEAPNGNLKKALILLSTFPHKMCQVISLKFAISIPLVSTKPELWYLNRIVGRIENENTIIMNHNFFIQEVIDEFKHQNVKVIFNP